MDGKTTRFKIERAGTVVDGTVAEWEMQGIDLDLDRGATSTGTGTGTRIQGEGVRKGAQAAWASWVEPIIRHVVAPCSIIII